MATPVHALSKRCVLCGCNLSGAKVSREHVLPKWLLRYTGNVNRPVFLYGKRRPFSTLHLAACSSCNHAFGASLEADAEQVVRRTILGEPLAKGQIETLLNWLDKVRVGLWWTSLQMRKNPLLIKPNFAAGERVSGSDRIVVIYKSIESNPGLTAIGIDTMQFMSMPSCFALKVNNVVFLNISAPFVLAYELGLPAPARHHLGAERSSDAVDMWSGSEVLSEGFVTLPYFKGGRELIQPIAGRVPVELLPLFDTASALKYLGVAPFKNPKLFYVDSGLPVEYGDDSSYEWQPDMQWGNDYLMDRVVDSVVRVQISLASDPLLAPRLPHNQAFWRSAV